MRKKDSLDATAKILPAPAGADEPAAADQGEEKAPSGGKSWKALGQIGVVLGICLAGEGIAAALPVPFPASVVSMVLLFLLLLAKVIHPHHLKEKAGFLMDNMAIFFVPAGVGIMTRFGAIRDSLLPLLAVCVLTTIITFAVTAFTVRGVVALQNRARARRNGAGFETGERGESRGNNA